jgi:hypothetical protein
MNKFKSFFLQQIIPGVYASYANKIISENYKSQQNFDVDISAVSGNEEEYIKQIKNDLENQFERKKRIEDKAKSLLFIIAVAVTAITFSLNYLKSLTIDVYQTISIAIVFLSIVYLMFGAIRALQTLNIRPFNIIQAEVDKSEDRYVLQANQKDTNCLKDIIKKKQLNDLINIRLSNYTYASFNLIRNGIVLFVLFFITTISYSYFSKKEKISSAYKIEMEINVKISDSVDVNILDTIEVKGDGRNLELKMKKNN